MAFNWGSGPIGPGWLLLFGDYEATPPVSTVKAMTVTVTPNVSTSPQVSNLISTSGISSTNISNTVTVTPSVQNEAKA